MHIREQENRTPSTINDVTQRIKNQTPSTSISSGGMARHTLKKCVSGKNADLKKSLKSYPLTFSNLFL